MEKKPNLEKLAALRQRMERLKRASGSINFDLSCTLKQLTALKTQRDRLKNTRFPDEVEVKELASVNEQISKLTEKTVELKARYEEESKATAAAIGLLSSCREYLKVKGIEVE